MTHQPLSLHEWAVANFAGAELSHQRRLERAITIAEAMAASPGASLPQMFAHPYDLKAAYRFLRHPEATPDNLQAGHRERVLIAMEQPGTYLLLEDTTEVLCAKEQPIEGLGPVGASKSAKLGFHLHSLLALRWPSANKTVPPHRPPVAVLGLADQQYHVRQPRSAAEKGRGSLRRRRPAQELESDLWERACQRLGASPDNPEVRWIKVCDRGADIYDHIRSCQQQRHRFVIRAKQDRVVMSTDGRRTGKLFEKVRASLGLAHLSLELRGRAGKAGRRALLVVSRSSVILRAPQVGGQLPGAREPLVCRVIRVWEPNPPLGVEALEWILLTDLEVENFEQACEVVQMYSTRWLEEEFHKALKTGMGAERMQLTTAQEWFAAIALLSVAALRLIELREAVRERADGPAVESGLSQLELEVLRVRSGKALISVSEVGLAIGRLGGHLNRKSDGLPGWMTLWRGWQILQTLVEGVLLARKLTNSG